MASSPTPSPKRAYCSPSSCAPIRNSRKPFEIIAGERRWRAAQLAQLHELPVIVRTFSDREALEVALVENLQRQDLSPLDEAEGYRRLMDEFGHTHDDLGRTIGKSRSHVANTLRLLALPAPVKRLVADGLLSAGHARALLASDDPESLARRVIDGGLNVRQTEQLVNASRPGGRSRSHARRRTPIRSLWSGISATPSASPSRSASRATRDRSSCTTRRWISSTISSIASAEARTAAGWTLMAPERRTNDPAVRVKSRSAGAGEAIRASRNSAR